MRGIGLVLALGLFSVGAARAGDLADPVWAKAPDRADWAKAIRPRRPRRGCPAR